MFRSKYVFYHVPKVISIFFPCTYGTNIYTDVYTALAASVVV